MQIPTSLIDSLPETEVLEGWLNANAPAVLNGGSSSRLRGRNSALSAAGIAAIGMRALVRVRQGQPVGDISQEESDGLEALVVMIGRPAIRIQHGLFASPVPPGWEMLESHRSSIERVCQSVGRIDLQGHPMYPWAGTGFLVAPDVVMTNRHVANAFTDLTDDGDWTFTPGVHASIDYTESPDVDPPVAVRITGVIGIHADLDLALLRVEPDRGRSAALPEPLVLATQPPDPDERRSVYVVGYPARDPRNDPEVMQQIFGDVYGVKRLQPGMSGEVFPDQRIIRHDCSTLGGNSGSCVVDLLSGEVVGLHFRGFYMKYNEAVALGCLVDDPLLRAAGIRAAASSGGRSKPARPRRDDRFRVD